MMFKEIKGHTKTIRQLKTAVFRGEVHHAYLFHGPEGVGKGTTALALAAALNCLDSLEGDSCGKCQSCMQMEKGVHPNLHWLFPQGKSIKIEQIKALQEKLSYKRWQGNYTVAIVDEADLMTEQAENSLLKILEEPHPGVCFILLTDRPESFLPTIISRCQKMRFGPLSVKEIHSLLLERGVAEGLGKQIAGISNGKPSKALAILADEGVLQEREKALNFCKLLSEGGVKEAFEVSEALQQNEGETLMEWMALWWRDLLVWQLARSEKLIVNLDLLDQIKKGNFATESLRQALAELEKGRYRLNKNANRKLCFDVMALKINLGFELSK